MFASKNTVRESNAIKRNSTVQDYKPLRGYSIYLDINNNLISQKLTEQITQLGGTVETFLNKGVKYLVTNRPNWKLNAKESSCENSMIGTPSSLTSASRSSTIITESPFLMEALSNRIALKAVKSRADTLLEKANKSMKYSEDVLKTAAKYKIRITHLTQFNESIKKLLAKIKPATQSNKVFGKGMSKLKLTTISVSRTRLISPFMKYEDVTGKFCPHYRSFSQWPVLDFATNHSQSPFRKVSQSKAQKNEETTKNETHISTPKLENSRVAKEEKSAFIKQSTVSVGNKPGYCEICSTKYSNFYDHVGSEKHHKIVSEPHFYSKLDKYLASLPSLKQIHERYMSNSSKENSTSRSPLTVRETNGFKVGSANSSINRLNSPVTTNRSRVFRFGENCGARKRLKLDAEPSKPKSRLPFDDECKENVASPLTDYNKWILTPESRALQSDQSSFLQPLQNDPICNAENVNNMLPNASGDEVSLCLLKATPHRLLRSTSQRRSLSSNATVEPSSSSPLVATREHGILHDGNCEEESFAEPMQWKSMTPLNLSTKLTVAGLANFEESACHAFNISKHNVYNEETLSANLDQFIIDNGLDDSALEADEIRLMEKDVNCKAPIDSSFIPSKVSASKLDENNTFLNPGILTG